MAEDHVLTTTDEGWTAWVGLNKNLEKIVLISVNFWIFSFAFKTDFHSWRSPGCLAIQNFVLCPSFDFCQSGFNQDLDFWRLWVYVELIFFKFWNFLSNFDFLSCLLDRFALYRASTLPCHSKLALDTWIWLDFLLNFQFLLTASLFHFHSFPVSSWTGENCWLNSALP